MNDEDVLLLAEENKAYRSALSPESQLIAEAVATFNTITKKKKVGIPTNRD
jgi:hypothetical protein